MIDFDDTIILDETKTSGGRAENNIDDQDEDHQGPWDKIGVG